MNKIVLTALAGMSAVVLATPAFAQSGDPAPFAGLYVGAAVSYNAQPNDFQEQVTFDRNLDGRFGDTVTTAAGANAFSPGFCNGQAISNVPAGGCRNDRDDWGFSGRVGFDVPVGGSFHGGGFIVGLVGDIGKNYITDSVSAFSTTPASYTLRRQIDYDAGARVRVGYFQNKTLFYATGGGKYARLKETFQTTNVTNAFSTNGKQNAWGYSAGGGLEQKIGPHFSIGIEYLFNRVKDKDARVRATAGSAPATNPFILAPNVTGTDFKRSVDNFTWHTGQVTAAFRF